MPSIEMIRESVANWDNFSEEVRNDQVYSFAIAYLEEKEIPVPDDLSARYSFMLLKKHERRLKRQEEEKDD